MDISMMNHYRCEFDLFKEDFIGFIDRETLERAMSAFVKELGIKNVTIDGQKLYLEREGYKEAKLK